MRTFICDDGVLRNEQHAQDREELEGLKECFARQSRRQRSIGKLLVWVAFALMCAALLASQ